MGVCPVERRTRFQQVSKANWTLIQMEMQEGNFSGAQQGEEHQPSNDWHFKVGFWKQGLSSPGDICCLFYLLRYEFVGSEPDSKSMIALH